MFCFCQILGVSGAEFGPPNDLGYEAERRWAPRALMVMCPRACGEAVEALCRFRDLRGTQTLQVTSTLILNMMHTLASWGFFFSDILTFFFFFLQISQQFARASQVVFLLEFSKVLNSKT